MTRSRTAPPESQSDLSEAARAVVHDAGDPRIDAHLAALGLGPDPAPPPTRVGQPAPEAAQLQVLRDRVAELEHELAAVRVRGRLLTVLLAAASVAILALLTLQVL